MLHLVLVKTMVDVRYCISLEINMPSICISILDIIYNFYIFY